MTCFWVKYWHCLDSATFTRSDVHSHLWLSLTSTLSPCHLKHAHAQASTSLSTRWYLLSFLLVLSSAKNVCNVCQLNFPKSFEFVETFPVLRIVFFSSLPHISYHRRNWGRLRLSWSAGRQKHRNTDWVRWIREMSAGRWLSKTRIAYCILI